MIFDQSVKYWIMESIMNDRQANRTSVGTTKHMSHNVKKTVPFYMCVQRRLKSTWASAQSDQSLRCTHEENLASLAILNAPSEYSSQTARMRKLI